MLVSRQTSPNAVADRKSASMDPLQLLILSQDSRLVALVRAVLKDLGVVGSYFGTDSTRALEVLGTRHFDGIILDCHDLASAHEILRGIRRGPSNRQTPVVAVTNATTDMLAIQNSDANFSICRPVTPETIKAQLNKAFDAMQREHRRYFRYAVSLPLFVGTKNEGLASGRLMNVSAEGLSVWLSRSAKPEGVVSLRFDLPSIEPYRIEAKGEVAWADAEGRIGIKLSHMPEEARRKYAEWLDVLYAQLQFRRLTEGASQSNP